MKLKRTFIKASSLFLLVAITLSLICGLTSCDEIYAGSREILSREQLLANCEREDDADSDYSAEYFDEWDFPRFNISKIELLERIYRKNFVNEFADPLTKAKETALVFLEKYYAVTPLDDAEAVTDALISSYVETMNDPYSFYRTRDEYEDYSSDMSGSFVGIGVTVRYYPDQFRLCVESVTKGSGADESGILAGDVITGVNGKSVKELGYDATLREIKGKEGTAVTLSVSRGEESLTFTVTRKKIVEQTVRYEIRDNIAYVTISGFKDNSYSQFKTAIDEIVRSGACGIVYDLRDNPGGYLSAVCDMLDYIAPKGTELVSFSNNYSEPTKAKNSHTVSLPSVVVCNKNTASAGELFTAAIRDFSEMGFFKAKIVGETTYGKGIMQNTYKFRDGASITMTVAYYNPPLRKNYHGVGIEPDEILSADSDSEAWLSLAAKTLKSLINTNK